MQELNGTRIAKGLAVGVATYIEDRALKIPSHQIDEKEVTSELNRLHTAIADCVHELKNIMDPGFVNDSERAILNTHIEILNDPELNKNLEEAIAKELSPAPKAVQDLFKATVDFFQSLDNDTFRQRAADYNDVKHRLLGILLGENAEVFNNLDSQQIPIFGEISPSQVSLLHRKGVRAFVADTCSPNSHAAIISRALGIAVVVGIPELRSTVKQDSMVVIDADAAKLIVDPSDEILEYYAQRLQVEELIRQRQEKLKQTECVTKDGVSITLYANIGVPEELPLVKSLDCDGIGLFRTEFIYLSSNILPSEEEQFEIYRQVVSEMAPKPVTIRTFDLGGDKLLHLIPSPHENNPYLGNRGIRFSLSHPELFKTQLRAIIRASAFGKVRVMFPMVIDVADFMDARSIFKSCADDLYYEGVEFDKDIEVGTMIEIPAAALSSELLARECDFFSIGTNDLAQYALAVDRNSENVSRYYITHHPAVLELIRITVKNAAKHRIPVSLCGEMASSAEYVPLLIGMGISELSINAASHFSVKEVAQRCDAHLREIIGNFDFATTLPKVDELVYRTLKPYYSEHGRK